MKKELLEKIINLSKNVIVEGDVSSGKTTNVMFPIVEKIVEKKESLFILDSKEEYISKYHKLFNDNGYNTIIVNLRDMGLSEGWNLLEYPYRLYKSGNKDKALDYLEKIVNELFREEESNDPFWSNTAANYFTGLCLALFEDGSEDEININSINMMAESGEARFGTTNYIKEYFNLKDYTSMSYINASSTFLAPVETKGGILSVFRQKTRLLVAREALCNLMSKTTFNLEGIVNKPTAFILIGKDESRELNSIAVMFIEQLLTLLFDKNIKRFNVILDNFDSVDKINCLSDMVSSSMSRNIKMYIITRYISELEKKYGTYLTKVCSRLSIHSNNVVLNVSGEDETFDKNFVTCDIEKDNSYYPKLERRNIKLFDLKSKVVDAKKAIFDGKGLDNVDLEEPINIDQLIKNIDDKIAELEKEEKEYQNKNKSDLEQFKV